MQQMRRQGDVGDPVKYESVAGPSRLGNVDTDEPQIWRHSIEVKDEPQVKNEIDLTAEDYDEFEVVDARGPSVMTAPDEHLCLGQVNLGVMCLYGLPKELQWPPLTTIDTVNRHAKWQRHTWSCSGLEFILEPGYRPVDMSKWGLTGYASPQLDMNVVITPMDMQAASSYGQDAGQPGLMQPSFGQVTENHAKALYPLLSEGKIRLLFRCRLVSPAASQNFMHFMEALVFCKRKHMSEVVQHFKARGLMLQRPARYTPSEYNDSPELLIPIEGAVQDALQRQNAPVLESVGTLIPTKEESEQEMRKQVDAVYASLPDGESLPNVKADETYIKTKLLPHQEKALAFLLDREKKRSFREDGRDGGVVSLWRPRWMGGLTIVSYEHVVTRKVQMKAPHICYGAILADDMGLGKTLTTISLIANTLDEARDWCKQPILSDDARDDEAADLDDDDDEDVKIEDFSFNLSGIAPPVAKRARKGPLRNEKKKGKREGRRDEKEEERAAQIKKRSRATLLVLPLTLVTAWEGQLKEHWVEDDQPKVYVHHGPTRSGDVNKIAKHHIVMTTYSTLAAEYSVMVTAEEESSDEGADTTGFDDDRKSRRKREAKIRKRKRREEMRKRKETAGAGPLQQIEWYRVVLDEAHTIKESRTLQARAVSYLMARSRVCLTGTPVQNKIDDLFSLLHFLRLQPFDDRSVWNQFCSSKDAPSLNTSGKRIANDPDKKGDVIDSTALARIQTVMKFLTIRRTKESRSADGELILKLPPKYSRKLQLEFEPHEKATYNEMRQRYKDEFEEMKANDTLKYNYATILHEISNLRMTCDHLELVEVSKDVRRMKEAGEDGVPDDPQQAILSDGISRDRAVRYFDVLCEADQARCMMCSYDLANFLEIDSGPGSPDDDGKVGAVDTHKEPVLTRCTHLFCTDCLQDSVRHLGIGDIVKNKDEQVRFDCPSCGTLISPLTEMRVLKAGDVEQRKGVDVLAEEKFGADVGTPIAQRSDYSTKISALMQDLETFSRSNRSSRLYDPSAPNLDQVEADATERDAGMQPVYVTEAASPTAPIKSVIFSQWTTMLDRIARAVHRAGIKAAYLDGRMRRHERNINLEKFRTDSSYEVLLVSLKAGGVGLNLVSACRAYLMEPYWNPATENQGLDRIHRMGQVRPVVTTKYIMNNSIEERMLDLQRHKMQLAESVGAKRRGPMNRVEELSILFGDGGNADVAQNDHPPSSQTASEPPSP
jgi:SNF2 family DNA or RNA helicase